MKPKSIAAILRALALSLVALFVLAGPTLAQSTSSSVTISDFKFTPASLTIPAGTTVTWTNNGPTIHTATSDSGAFDSGILKAGQSFRFTFTTPGSFSYHCAIHPNMKAVIIVTANQTSPAPAAAGGSASATPASSPPASPRASASTAPASVHPSPASATLSAGASPAASGSAVAGTRRVPGNLPKTGQGGGAQGNPTWLGLLGLFALVTVGFFVARKTRSGSVR